MGGGVSHCGTFKIGAAVVNEEVIRPRWHLQGGIPHVHVLGTSILRLAVMLSY
jgi:hypothetical protein